MVLNCSNSTRSLCVWMDGWMDVGRSLGKPKPLGHPRQKQLKQATSLTRIHAKESNSCQAEIRLHPPRPPHGPLSFHRTRTEMYASRLTAYFQHPPSWLSMVPTMEEVYVMIVVAGWDKAQKLKWFSEFKDEAGGQTMSRKTLALQLADGTSGLLPCYGALPTGSDFKRCSPSQRLHWTERWEHPIPIQPNGQFILSFWRQCWT